MLHVTRWHHTMKFFSLVMIKLFFSNVTVSVNRKNRKSHPGSRYDNQALMQNTPSKFPVIFQTRFQESCSHKQYAIELSSRMEKKYLSTNKQVISMACFQFPFVMIFKACKRCLSCRIGRTILWQYFKTSHYLLQGGGGGREERGWSGVGGFWGVTWSFMGNGAGSVVVNGVEEHYWKLTAS